MLLQPKLRVCALIATRYPDYWPETIRGLLIHGARYTDEMLKLLPAHPGVDDKIGLLRRMGHGAVRATNALNSTAQRPADLAGDDRSLSQGSRVCEA